MTGDAPQPGETPRTESEPWSFPDPNTAWWRVEEEHDRQEALVEVAAVAARPARSSLVVSGNASAAAAPAPQPEDDTPAFAAEALDAHAAGAQDLTKALASPAAQDSTKALAPPAAQDPTKALAPPAALVEAEHEAEIEKSEAEAAAHAVDALRAPVERDHDHRPRHRYQPPDQKGHAVRTADEKPTQDEPEPHAEDVPDVMVLPEPDNRNRPTVVLDRHTVPGQAVAGTSRLGRTSDDARRERLENHPFWNEEERAAVGNALPAPGTRERPATGTPPVRKHRNPRGPLAGLLGLLILGLIAAFFSWVSAEPFWLTVGHGESGVATVSQCTGDGVTQRCRGVFTADDGSFRLERVTLLGVDAGSRNAGAVMRARMVSPDSEQAYVGGPGLLLHLRWTLGFALVVLCGYAIAGMTGARRLETARARRSAVLMSLAGPLLLLLGFLAAAY